MFSPMVSVPARWAPMLAASMMPGPPPVQMYMGLPGLALDLRVEAGQLEGEVGSGMVVSGGVIFVVFRIDAGGSEKYDRMPDVEFLEALLRLHVFAHDADGPGFAGVKKLTVVECPDGVPVFH